MGDRAKRKPDDRLGEFELSLLIAVAHLADEAYGLRIRREIERRTGRHVAIGALYTSLNRLEDKRYVDPRCLSRCRSAAAVLGGTSS